MPGCTLHDLVTAFFLTKYVLYLVGALAAFLAEGTYEGCGKWDNATEGMNATACIAIAAAHMICCFLLYSPLFAYSPTVPHTIMLPLLLHSCTGGS
jgi:hypothetical protein